MHVDAKANRTDTVHAEDAHQAALAALAEEFASEIEESYAVANTETEKNLEAESWRILADRDHMNSLSKERTKHDEKMDKEHASQRSIVAHSHKQWIKTLARNLSTQKKASEKEQKKESEECKRSWKWWSGR